MALQQVFTISESQDGETIYIDDDTGDYDVSTNPGGYGTPNPARADVALILIANYKSSTGDEAMTITSYDPESVTQFIITSADTDGHIEFDIYTIAKKTGAEVPATNDFVYDFSANQLERWNGSAWVSATTADLVTYDEVHTTLDYPHIPELWMAKNNLVKLYILGCKSTKRDDLFKMIVNTNTMIDGVLALFAEHSYSQAQENIENYQNIVDEILTLQVS